MGEARKAAMRRAGLSRRSVSSKEHRAGLSLARQRAAYTPVMRSRRNAKAYRYFSALCPRGVEKPHRVQYLCRAPRQGLRFAEGGGHAGSAFGIQQQIQRTAGARDLFHTLV